VDSAQLSAQPSKPGAQAVAIVTKAEIRCRFCQPPQVPFPTGIKPLFKTFLQEILIIAFNRTMLNRSNYFKRLSPRYGPLSLYDGPDQHRRNFFGCYMIGVLCPGTH